MNRPVLIKTDVAASAPIHGDWRACSDRSAGAQATVLTAAHSSMKDGVPAALAVVLETEGSVYAKRGSLALFGSGRQVGWLSGGCLEPALLSCGELTVETDTLRLLEIDNLDDSALFSGGATGCRGRQLVALFPLSAAACLHDAIDTWYAGGAPIDLTVMASGEIRISCAAHICERTLSAVLPENVHLSSCWKVRIAPPPRALLLGAGPEAIYLSTMLGNLGWHAKCREPRATWRDRSGTSAIDASVPISDLMTDFSPDAVLLMHHNFELDLESLQALAASPCDFIGLLGPVRRRKDLLKFLEPAIFPNLMPRLRSPVGLRLGSSGPAGIALSICAELEEWRSGRFQSK
ncbi:xanthine dehydrogenase accessory factor [Xanthomonas arboricola]|uniref:XdhC family protein n=1 Tax=Xanthomonas sp. 3793 TaxID=3035312 RepID=UPI00216926B3|nr:XdhC family protein [Xanthomonas sp. 3793]MCS3744608.1 xanthine dehydrogenase accessory factor [Xanthomonas sp. 3793]